MQPMRSSCHNPRSERLYHNLLGHETKVKLVILMCRAPRGCCRLPGRSLAERTVEKPNSVTFHGYNNLQQVFIGAVDSYTQCLPFLRKHSPDGATRNGGRRHPIAPYIYGPQRDERLSWPGRLTYSGRFTHISGHPSATGLEQDRESSPAKDRRSTAVPRNQFQCSLIITR